MMRRRYFATLLNMIISLTAFVVPAAVAGHFGEGQSFPEGADARSICPWLNRCSLPTDIGGVAWDGEHLWIGDDESTLYEYYHPYCSVVRTIPMPGTICDGIAWDGASLWTSSEYTETIYKVDPENGDVLASFPTPGVLAAGLAWDGEHLWHASYDDDMIWKLDSATGSVLASFPAPSGCPAGLAFAGGVLIMSDCQNHHLYFIDPASGDVLDECEIYTDHPWGVAVPGDDSVWVSGTFDGYIYHQQIDVLTPVEAATWSVVKGSFR